MRLFSYNNIRDFSKGLHIFVRGVYLKARKENDTAYPGKIPSKSSKVLKSLEPCLALWQSGTYTHINVGHT